MRLALMLVAGCVPELGEPVPLLDPMALMPLGEEADPFASHRPVGVDCPPGAWGEEGGSFEVQTGVCSYAAFSQALPVVLVAGDTLAITVWHDTLDAAEPADGHAAITVGPDVVWEAEVAIPAPSASFEALVVLEETPDPDAPLGLHLHNHGFNSWRFVAVDLMDGR